MTNNLTPYDTGEVLEPHPWVNAAAVQEHPVHAADPRIADDYGKVDFDNDEGVSLFRVQIVKNDPLPEGGEPYTIRITSYAGDRYIIETEES